MKKAILELNGELCVSVPIQNPTCKPVCLSSRDILGQIQPITVVPEPKVFAALLAWDTSNQQQFQGVPVCLKTLTFSPWSSLVVLVTKKDRSTQFYIDQYYIS